MLGQVPGRTADDAAYCLLQAPPAWRDRVEVATIGMCTLFLSAARLALPKAQSRSIASTSPSAGLAKILYWAVPKRWPQREHLQSASWLLAG